MVTRTQAYNWLKKETAEGGFKNSKHCKADEYSFEWNTRAAGAAPLRVRCAVLASKADGDPVMHIEFINTGTEPPDKLVNERLPISSRDQIALIVAFIQDAPRNVAQGKNKIAYALRELKREWEEDEDEEEEEEKGKGEDQ